MLKKAPFLVLGFLLISPFLSGHPYLPDPRHFGTPGAYQRACKAAEERHKLAVEKAKREAGEEEGGLRDEEELLDLNRKE